MDIHNRLQECFEKLGYSSNFPSTLHVNSSTNYVWQQWINIVKPKTEVSLVRSNLIINRFQNKVDDTNPTVFPIREVQVFQELHRVREKIEISRAAIQEKKNKALILQQANKNLCLLLNTLRAKIEEKNVEIYALQLKFYKIESEIEEIENLINKRVLVSITEEDSCPTELVVDKLHNIVQRIQKKTKNPPITKLAKSQHTNLSQHNKCNILRPQKNCYSTIKKDKTGLRQIQRFRSCNNVNSVRALFTDSFKENEIIIDNVANRANEIALLDQSTEILPDACFDFRADDQFLTSFQTSFKLKSTETGFSKGESMFEDSLKFSGQMNSQFMMDIKHKLDYVELVHSDKDITENIDALLNTANKKITWSTLCSLRENLLGDIKVQLESSKEKLSFRNTEINQEDIVKLKFIYIKNNLQILKNKKKMKNLKVAIDKEKMDIEKQLCEHFAEDHLKVLDMQLENLGLDTCIQFIYKETNNNSRSNSRRTLTELSTKISKKKDDLIGKMREIEDYRSSKDDLMDKIQKCQDDTNMCFRKLNKFICEPVWAGALTENVHLNEITAFQNFPLHLNRRFCFTSKDMFYKNALRSLIFDELASDDTSYMITTVLGHPQKSPEFILKEILRKKNKLQVLKYLHFPSVDLPEEIGCLKDLEDQEKYVEKFCETLISHVRSAKANQIMNSSSRMKSSMQLWIEMPFRSHISKNKLVSGKSYKDYEKDFEYFSNN